MSVSGATPEPISIGRQLTQSGWLQGAVITTERVLAVARLGQDLLTFAGLPPQSKLVVVSQSCDIDRSVDDEPIVEALVCVVDSRLAESDFTNSARYFLIDPESGLVAFAANRVLIRKAVLLAIRPDEFTWPESYFPRFTLWLASRWKRVEFPDACVIHVINPLRDSLKKHRKKNSPEWQALSRYVYHFRIGHAALQSDATLEVSLTILIKPDTPATEMRTIRDAVDAVVTKVRKESSQHVTVDGPWLNRPDRLSLADAWVLRPVDLDYLSLDEDGPGLLADGPE